MKQQLTKFVIYMSFHFFAFIGNRSVANIIAWAVTPATIKHKIKDMQRKQATFFNKHTARAFCPGKKK